MDPRDEIKQLDAEKARIESELIKEFEILKQNGTDLRAPLVSVDGYPRADIDVYNVRHARHKINRLQNDHKALLEKIETKLHEIHAKTRQNSGEEALSSEISPSANLIPFAKIDRVDMGSPSFIDGLQVEDLVCRFGSITADNFRHVSDVGSLVNNSINKQIKVVVQREKNELVYLTPRRWEGKGLLGCNIIPYELVER